MGELLTKDPSADDIARAIVDELVTDRNKQLSSLVKEQVREILGALPTDDRSAAFKNFLHEQIEASVTQKVKDANIEEELAAVREALATKAPERAADNLSLEDIWDSSKANPAAVGAQIDGRFGGFIDYIRGVATLNPRVQRDRDPRLSMLGEHIPASAALTGEEIELGGALVPEEFRSQLMMMALQPTSIRPKATVIPMMSQTLSVPAIRDKSHSGGTVYGGIHFQWMESGNTIPASDPEFTQIRLIAKLLVGRTDINNTMLMDSFTSLPNLLGMMWPMAHRWSEELAFMRGTGAGQPLGIKQANCLIDSGDTLSGDFDVGAAANMLSHLLPESYSSACWLIHPSILPELVQMTVGSTSAFQFDYSQPVPGRLFGLPVIFTEHCDGNGTSGDVFLADWRFYLIGDRQAMSMAASEHNKFPEYQTVFRSVSRLDAQPWMDTALTLRDGSHMVSPFVVR